MKEQFENLNKQVSKHRNIVFSVVAGILSLTLAFGVGQLTAPVDRESICKTYTNDITTLESQLSECRSTRVIDCDEKIRECHEQERAACQETLNEFRSRCEELACQE